VKGFVKYRQQVPTTFLFPSSCVAKQGKNNNGTLEWGREYSKKEGKSLTTGGSVKDEPFLR